MRLLDVLARQAADLIERKRIEETLRESDRRKDEFLATLAHELRNPLAPIKNGLRIAQLTISADSPLKHTVEVMARQLNHLVHLVDDLLDVARINSGKLELCKQRVPLKQALACSIECIQPHIDEHKHELVIDMGSDELFVEGDLDRLSQMFANLLSNAAKYTEPGGRISLCLTREGDKAVVKVADNGVGRCRRPNAHFRSFFPSPVDPQVDRRRARHWIIADPQTCSVARRNHRSGKWRIADGRQYLHRTVAFIPRGCYPNPLTSTIYDSTKRRVRITHFSRGRQH